MANVFLILTFIFAALNWFAVYDAERINKRLERIAKPATILCLFLYFLSAKSNAAPLLWFGLAIVLSAAGDIFLLFDQLMGGLAAFLLAHVCYIIGFNMPVPPLTSWSLLFAVTYGLMSTRIYRRISTALTNRGLVRLKKPVLAYTIVITLMLLSATLTLSHPAWKPVPAVLVFSGAALFFLSDVTQAFHRFEAPTRRGRFITMLTYHLGQIGLIVGAVLQFR